MALIEMLSACRTVDDFFPTFSLSAFLNFFVYFLKVLLRYNSQAIKFTHFKYNRVVVFSRFTVIQLSPLCNFRTFSLCQKGTQYSLAITLHSSILSKPSQPVIYFLSLQIMQFWTYHMNDRMWNPRMWFCDWFLSLSMVFSRFVYDVVCVSTLTFAS